MPGAHSRSADDAAPATTGTARRSRSTPPRRDARIDTGQIDRDYGDLPRSSGGFGPAPLSPPVGFPTALSPASFGSSASPPPQSTPPQSTPSPHPTPSVPPPPEPARDVAPLPAAGGGVGGGVVATRARSAASPASPGVPLTVPPPPPLGGADRSDRSVGRPPSPECPAAPARPVSMPAPRAVGTAQGAAHGNAPAPSPGRPVPPPPRTGTVSAPQQGPGAPPQGPISPPQAPGAAPQGPLAPSQGPGPGPGAAPRPAGPGPAHPPSTSATARPAPARPGPGAPAGQPPARGPRPPAAAAPGPATTSAPGDPTTRAAAPAKVELATKSAPTEDGGEAGDAPATGKPTGTTRARHDIRTSSVRGGSGTSSPGSPRSSGSSRSTSHTPTGPASDGTTRSRAASRPARGRVAAAVAGVTAAIAAWVARLPGGERLVAAVGWVLAKVRRYLDGPRPEKLTTWGLRWRRGRRTAYAGFAGMIGAPVLALVLGWLFIPVPNADEAVQSQLNTVSFSDGTLLARVSPGEQGNRQKVSIEQVPLPVQRAVLAAEDRSYYENSGFDVGGIARAAYSQLTGGVGGGSTITQQYVKNAMVGNEHSLMRKYKELIISTKISQERSKDEILADYLNSIYFGRGAYGIQAASQAYFGRGVETLSPAEGALLAGVIQAPSRWDPAVRYDDSVRRWNYVMDGMVSQGWMSAQERGTAQFPATVPPQRVANGVPNDDRGHIYSAVKAELSQIGINEDALVTEGLQIETTIRPEAQREAVQAAQTELEGQPENLRSAVVSIDPSDGSILAYYGGDNGSGLDYARVEKQPGSVFKPFVLLAALQQDPPIALSEQFDGRAIPGQTVRNSDGADCTSCNLKEAMTISNNVVFMDVGDRVGPQAVADAARQAGITSEMAEPTSGIALGNAETTPVDMASAYATFANDGMYFRPHLVSKVTSAAGDVLYEHTAGEGEQRIDPEVARNVTEAMTDVPESAGAALSGSRAAAAKTGTVQSHLERQNNDAWMVGYTPGMSTSIWIGTDDNTPIQTSGGTPIFGHGLPSELWKSYMDDALQGTQAQSFADFTPIAGTDPSTPTTTEAPPTTTTSTPAPTTSETPPPSEEPPPPPPVLEVPPELTPTETVVPPVEGDVGVARAAPGAPVEEPLPTGP